MAIRTGKEYFAWFVVRTALLAALAYFWPMAVLIYIAVGLYFRAEWEDYKRWKGIGTTVNIHLDGKAITRHVMDAIPRHIDRVS